MITNNDRDQAEATATPVQMELFATTEAGRQLWAIAEHFGVTADDTYGTFSIIAGDVVLKLLSPEELATTLQEHLPSLAPAIVTGLTQAILDYAAPALNETPDNPGTPNPVLQEELQRLKDAATPEPLPTENEAPDETLTTQDPSLQAEIDELEQAVSPVELVHTMENDATAAQREQTYASSQDAILPNNQPPQPPQT